MTRVRIEDLPPALRRQVEAKAASGSAPRDEGAKTGTRGSRSGDPGPRYRCVKCGEEFARYGAAAERHADGHGGARLDAIIGAVTPEG